MAKRTGLRTLFTLLRRLCQLNATWGSAILLVLPSQYHVYYMAVTQACDDFILNVPEHTILDDETP